MCGIVGWFNNKQSIRNKREILKQMTETLRQRGPDASGYYFKKNILLGHRRLSIIDIEKGSQPMSYKNYTIIFNGIIYNHHDIRNDLIKKGFSFNTNSDTEVLLKAYVYYKEKVLDILNGIFAFAIYNNNSLFIARDRLGIKPLFYTKRKNDFIFASEIKALLKSEIVKPIINKQSLQELLALGPSKTPGCGIFKDIKELKAAHYLIYKHNKIKIKRYWNVKDLPFKDSFKQTRLKVRQMVTEAIKRQMVADVDICCLLSGGLDSSIISAICSKELYKEGKTLNTYSIDYEDNKKHFLKNDFQISNDEYYIKLVSNNFNTNHSYKIINQQQLADYLNEAMIARDLPGMADIDSSLFWFIKEISNHHKVVLSGECADEIFGGYPWFYKEELFNKKGFPWINNLDDRSNLLSKELQKKLNLEAYANKQYKKALKEVPKCKYKKSRKYRQLFYLNMTWFMTTLLDRKDRMTMRSGIEARVPFSDHKLVEYLWNVPWEYKYSNNQEKGLLRDSFKDLLPKEIINRKKNPYPKTHHPQYTQIVSNLLLERLNNKDSVLYKIFDYDKILELIETEGKSYQNPWFGQLMTGPQLIAYLYQFDLWAEHYNIILEL